MNNSEKYLWLAKKVFEAFPRLVTGIKFYTLDCGCIYFHRVFPDGLIDPRVAVYSDDPCEVCLKRKYNWEGRVVDETVVYNSKFQMEGD